MYLGFWRIIALKPAPLLEVGRKCVSELSNSGQTVDADLAWAWANACSGAEFLFLLEERGYQLAKGDRRDWVVLDPMGGVHSPARRLRIRAAEIRERTRDLEEVEFPPIDAFRAELLRADQPAESVSGPGDESPEADVARNRAQEMKP